VASGVRRIEATVGRESLRAMNRNQELLFHASEVLKSSPAELAERAEATMAELRELRTALEKYKTKASLGQAEQFLTSFKRWRD
jgi:alanyl-tRNA synthetase